MMDIAKVPAILRIAEHGIKVSDIATTDLWSISPELTKDAALVQMRKSGFSQATLDELPIARFVTVADLEDGRPSSVAEVSRAIRSTELVSDTLGLAECVALLKDRAFVFVLAGSRVTGIVTRADIQRVPVAMVALTLILATEEGLSRMIRQRVPKWQSHLTKGRLMKASDVHRERKNQDAEIDLLECLYLHDRLTILKKDGTMLSQLGFESKTSFDEWSGRLTKARDHLAHGGSLLDTEADPQKAIELFIEIRRFAEKVWGVVDHIEIPADL